MPQTVGRGEGWGGYGYGTVYSEDLFCRRREMGGVGVGIGIGGR